MGAVETLETAIRLWMRNPRPDIAGAGERDERPPFAADKLAAPIVDELRFARTTARKRVERFLHGQHDEIGLHRHVQLPMHEIPAVSVQDVHEVVPAWPDVKVHQIDVPHLVGPIGWHRPPQRLRRKRWAAPEQVGLLEHLINLAWPQVRDILIDHGPGQALIAHERMRAGELAHRRVLLGRWQNATTDARRVVISQATRLCTCRPSVVGCGREVQLLQHAPHRGVAEDVCLVNGVQKPLLLRRGVPTMRFYGQRPP